MVGVQIANTSGILERLARVGGALVGLPFGQSQAWSQSAGDAIVNIFDPGRYAVRDALSAVAREAEDIAGQAYTDPINAQLRFTKVVFDQLAKYPQLADTKSSASLAFWSFVNSWNQAIQSSPQNLEHMAKIVKQLGMPLPLPLVGAQRSQGQGAEGAPPAGGRITEGAIEPPGPLSPGGGDLSSRLGIVADSLWRQYDSLRRQLESGRRRFADAGQDPHAFDRTDPGMFIIEQMREIGTAIAQHMDTLSKIERREQTGQMLRNLYPQLFGGEGTPAEPTIPMLPPGTIVPPGGKETQPLLPIPEGTIPGQGAMSTPPGPTASRVIEGVRPVAWQGNLVGPGEDGAALVPAVYRGPATYTPTVGSSYAGPAQSSMLVPVASPGTPSVPGVGGFVPHQLTISPTGDVQLTLKGLSYGDQERRAAQQYLLTGQIPPGFEGSPLWSLPKGVLRKIASGKNPELTDDPVRAMQITRKSLINRLEEILLLYPRTSFASEQNTMLGHLRNWLRGEVAERGIEYMPGVGRVSMNDNLLVRLLANLGLSLRAMADNETHFSNEDARRVWNTLASASHTPRNFMIAITESIAYLGSVYNRTLRTLREDHILPPEIASEWTPMFEIPRPEAIDAVVDGIRSGRFRSTTDPRTGVRFVEVSPPGRDYRLLIYENGVVTMPADDIERIPGRRPGW